MNEESGTKRFDHVLYFRSMIKLVILDFDDTLCLTEEATFQLENEVALSMGFKPMSRSTHQKTWGLPVKKVIAERIPGIDVDEFIRRHEKTVSKYFANGNLDAICSENLTALDKLKKAGRRLAILTSRSFSEIRHLLRKSHPLSSRVEKFYYIDNSEYLKPDPRAFGQILKHFKAEPEESIYVGDAVSDAAAARGAGLSFIAILESGLRTKKDFNKVKVDLFVKKFKDIVPFILQNHPDF